MLEPQPIRDTQSRGGRFFCCMGSVTYQAKLHTCRREAGFVNEELFIRMRFDRFSTHFVFLLRFPTVEGLP